MLIRNGNGMHHIKIFFKLLISVLKHIKNQERNFDLKTIKSEMHDAMCKLFRLLIYA